MSLIEEALRRVQNPQLPKSAPAAPAPPAAAPQKLQEPPQAHPWPLTVVSAPPARQPKAAAPKSFTPLVTVLAVMALGGWLASAAWFASHPRTSRLPASAAVVPAASKPAPLLMFAPVVTSPAALTLTGVVVGSGEPYAVIDGRIVGLGEPVGDGMVEQITPQHVTLRLPDGQEQILKVPR